MTNSDGTEAKAERKARLVGAWTTHLADLLQSTGLSQVAFAKCAGVDPSTLTRYLKGGSIPAEDRVEALLDALPQPLPDQEPARTWQLWEAACEVASRHEYEKHRLRGQVRQVRQQVDDLQQRLDIVQSDHTQAMEELAQTGLALTQAHRDLADTRRQLQNAEDSRDRERAARQQTERFLQQAADRLDRMKDAYEQLQEQARASLQAMDTSAETWQQRQAELLERLAVAEERRAEAEGLVQTAQLALAAEREAGQAAREEAAQDRQRVADSIRQAPDARRAASEAEARLRKEKTAHQAVRAAEDRYARASATITRLNAELNVMRQERDTTRARLASAEKDLAQAENARAVEDRARTIVDAAFQDQQQGAELAPAHREHHPDSPERPPSATRSPWFHQPGRSGTAPAPTTPAEEEPAPEVVQGPPLLDPPVPSRTEDDDTLGGLPSQPEPEPPPAHPAAQPPQAPTGADTGQTVLPGTGPASLPPPPSHGPQGTTPKGVHDAPAPASPGRHTASSRVRPWKSLGAALAGLAAVVTCGLLLKDSDVLSPPGPIEFVSGSKPTTQTGKGEYGSGSLSYSWKLVGGTTVKAHFDLTHQGGSDLPGHFTAQPLKGCRPDLTWTLTADEEEIEVDSGEITSGDRYGINGDVDDADSLDLTIKSRRPTQCTVTVTWGITTW